MKRKFFTTSAFLFFALLAPFELIAHGLGNSFEKEAGGYLVDIGYSEPMLRALVPTQLDFHLYETKDGKREPVPFTNAWVRISEKDKGFLFAGWLHQPSFGALGMTYAFPYQGEYEMTARFLKEEGGENKTITETSFSFPVGGEKERPFTTESLMILFVGGAVGFCSGLFLNKRKIL